MNRGMKAYLFMEETAVTEKRTIRNAKDEDFREITLYISDEEIGKLFDQIHCEREDEQDGCM